MVAVSLHNSTASHTTLARTCFCSAAGGITSTRPPRRSPRSISRSPSERGRAIPPSAGIPTSWSTLDSALSRAEEAPRAAAGVAVDEDTEGYHRTTAIVRERAITRPREPWFRPVRCDRTWRPWSSERPSSCEPAARRSPTPRCSRGGRLSMRSAMPSSAMRSAKLGSASRKP